MASRNWKQYPLRAITFALLSTAVALPTAFAHDNAEVDGESRGGMRFVQVAARDKHERSAISDAGMSIEATRSDSVWGFANQRSIAELKAKGYKILGDFDFETGRGGHDGGFGTLDFPGSDARFHNYAEMTSALKELEERNSDIVKLRSIGKSLEGRDILAIQINTRGPELAAGKSDRPGIIFMGNHHAREHLSAEIPLMLAQHLLDHRRNAEISRLLDSRDIWIIPMVNPDGVEYDISTGNYKSWRKNRRDNGNGTRGVDLNRNYAYGWGTGGSSKDPSSDIYMGKAPFSEPETQVVRDFVESHLNARILLSFHTYSELILYPWGGKNDPIANARDRSVFEKMATTMAAWNKYTPEQASDLYIASGDTTDWAYGTHGIFAFTFELSPSGFFGGGFYPGAGVIDKVFNDNLKPCLYLLETSGDPYQVLTDRPTGFLQHYVEPRADLGFLPNVRL